MTISEVIAAEVIEICDTLSGREEDQRRRLLVDVAENLLSATQFPTLEEQLETEIGGDIDPDSAPCRLVVAVNAG